MKLTKYFMPLAAVAMLASCSNDNIDAPAQNGPDNSKSETLADGVYLTLNISQAISTGSRTTNGKQGSEAGQSQENFISEALVLFAQGEAGSEKVVATIPFYIQKQNSDGTYVTKGKATTEFINTLFTDETYDQEQNGKTGDEQTATFQVYVIANPTADVKAKYNTLGGDVQQSLSVTSADVDKYWQNNYFLMSGKSTRNWTTSKSDLLSGQYTESSPCKIPAENTNVKVYRTMGRFDVNTNKANFYFGGEKSATNYEIQIAMKEVSLINMSDVFYLFEQVKTYATGNHTASGSPFFFTPDLDDNQYWVLDPQVVAKEANTYTNFINPLFVASTGDKTQVAPARLTSWTSYTAIANKFAGNDLSEDSDGNKAPEDSEVTDWTDYHFWTYCIPNSICDVDKYLNGNSTGVAFKAEMTFNPTMFADNANAVLKGELEAGAKLYGLNDVLVGGINSLEDYVASDNADVAVKAAYQRAYNAWVAAGSSEEIGVEAYLISEGGFTGYAAVDEGNGTPDYHYYCYYYYWNRHIDNSEPAIMGPMEFAVVHNNIYKLAVNSVSKLGHPELPGDDPDGPDPDDPDEDINPYFQVTCEVVPWTVRENGINF